MARGGKAGSPYQRRDSTARGRRCDGRKNRYEQDTRGFLGEERGATREAGRSRGKTAAD